MTISPWRPIFSVASVIALINSMVLGALTRIALDALASRSISLLAGVAVTAAALVLHFLLGRRHFSRALEPFRPLFPTATG